MFKCLLKCYSINTGCQHPHVVRAGPVHSGLGEVGTPQNVATAADNRNLNAVTCHPRDLAGDGSDRFLVDPVAALGIPKGLTGELQKNALVGHIRSSRAGDLPAEGQFQAEPPE